MNKLILAAAVLGMSTVAQAQVGHRVRFSAEQVDGALVVTGLEKAAP